MNILKIIYLYIFGYVNIEVEGFFIEKFINICFLEKIFLWKIYRNNSVSINARISVGNFKKIKKIAQKTKCRLHIKNKKGLPFILNKYKKRKIFAITLLVIAILIFGLTRFVWNIEIDADGEIDESEILELLKEEGIHEGILISKIDIDKVINKIMLERDDISWLGIKTSGTNVIVSIVMATEKPDIIDEDEICNIVSDKNAVIDTIVVQNGTARVSVGDTVGVGDLLVEGVMEGEYTENRYVHATADITAIVYYEKEETMELIQENYINTGNEENKYSVNINNFKINFNKPLPNFENYDTIETCKKLKLFSNFYIPVEIVKTTYIEKELEYQEYTIEELSNKLQIKLKQELLDENDISEDDIVEITPIITENENSVTVKMICSVSEEIGILEQLVY